LRLLPFQPPSHHPIEELPEHNLSFPKYLPEVKSLLNLKFSFQQLDILLAWRHVPTCSMSRVSQNAFGLSNRETANKGPETWAWVPIQLPIFYSTPDFPMPSFHLGHDLRVRRSLFPDTAKRLGQDSLNIDMLLLPLISTPLLRVLISQALVCFSLLSFSLLNLLLF